MEETPRPNDRHRRLQRLAGSWAGEETIGASPFGPAGAARGRFDMRVDVDGFFLIQDYLEERDGRVVYRGHGILGWDDPHNSYGWYWVDSMGSVPAAPARGPWEGDTLTLEHAPVADQRARYTYHLTEDARLVFRIESSRDGGSTWTQFMEGRYRRA